MKLANNVVEASVQVRGTFQVGSDAGNVIIVPPPEWGESPNGPRDEDIVARGEWVITQRNPTCFWLKIGDRWYYICT